MDIIEEYKKSRQRLFDIAGINPESKFAEANGPVKDVHYLELGSGKPLVLIHGGGSHSSQWINIMKPLSEHFHLYVVDRPGCGLNGGFNYRNINDYRQSAVDFIRSFMDAVGLEHAMFAGNSMGGYFSICFALEFPNRVDKLLLIGAPAGMNLWVPFPLRLMSIMGLNSLMSEMKKPGIKNTADLYKMIIVADISNVSEDSLQHDVHGQLIPGTAKSFLTLLEQVLTLRGWRRKLYLTDKLKDLKMPVRFIWGDKDVFESPDTGLEKAKTIADYKFEVVENAGHAPWMDKPNECCELMIRMLKE